MLFLFISDVDDDLVHCAATMMSHTMSAVSGFRDSYMLSQVSRARMPQESEINSHDRSSRSLLYHPCCTIDVPRS